MGSKSPGDLGYDQRWDLVPKGIVSKATSTFKNLAALSAGPTRTPPMLDGTAVFNGPTWPYPQSRTEPPPKYNVGVTS